MTASLATTLRDDPAIKYLADIFMHARYYDHEWTELRDRLEELVYAARDRTLAEDEVTEVVDLILAFSTRTADLTAQIAEPALRRAKDAARTFGVYTGAIDTLGDDRQTERDAFMRPILEEAGIAELVALDDADEDQTS